MTQQEIRAFFPVGEIHFGADNYHVPTLAWLQGPFYEAFHTDLWNNALDTWQVRWECRDFARHYASLAMKCWALTKDPSQDDALAIGEFWHKPTPSTAHAINACITDQGLVFIDPQNNSICQLSAEQLQSCFFLRF